MAEAEKDFALAGLKELHRLLKASKPETPPTPEVLATYVRLVEIHRSPLPPDPEVIARLERLETAYKHPFSRRERAIPASLVDLRERIEGGR